MNVYDDAPPAWQCNAALSRSPWGHRERRRKSLPGESAIKILFGPCGRLLLQVAKYIRDAMHWPETSQNMDMILDSADNLGHTVHASDDPTEIGMKMWLPFGFNERSSFFGREDNVIVKAEEG